jgi:DNA-binding transcriptional MerR regulator
MPHTPAQVAKVIGISVQAVRDWSRQYAPLLSPQARGAQGARLFDDNDVATLRTIAGLRRSGLRAEEIIRRVQDGEIPPIVDIAHESTPQQATETPQTPTDAPLALHIAHSALQSRIDAVERSVALLEQRQAARVDALVTGIVIGGAVVLIVVALVLALGQ